MLQKKPRLASVYDPPTSHKELLASVILEEDEFRFGVVTFFEINKIVQSFSSSTTITKLGTSFLTLFSPWIHPSDINYHIDASQNIISGLQGI